MAKSSSLGGVEPYILIHTFLRFCPKNTGVCLHTDYCSVCLIYPTHIAHTHNTTPAALLPPAQSPPLLEQQLLGERRSRTNHPPRRPPAYRRQTRGDTTKRVFQVHNHSPPIRRMRDGGYVGCQRRETETPHSTSLSEQTQRRRRTTLFGVHPSTSAVRDDRAGGKKYFPWVRRTEITEILVALSPTPPPRPRQQ